MTTSQDHWDRVKQVFQAALERSPASRPAFVAHACGDVRSLRAEVESLLRAHEQAGSFAEESAIDGVRGRLMNRGDRLGPYDIVELAGAGGMGEVYRARDPKLGRDVAIKVLPPVFTSDARRLARFGREARLLASLNHPHLLTVHDIGEIDGRPYLVTEFVDGGTLRAWIRSGARTWRQVVDLLAGVADGLAAAHSAGIVHRDVKPDNVLISKHGYAKLADFGLARLLEPVAAPPTTPTDTAVGTQAGMIVGTIGYMSPEQTAGKSADVRSDIFSFGVVLYEALSGRQPFAGASDLEVLQRVQHQTAEPLGEDMPPALRVVVEKALEKDPADRYQSMRDVFVDLRRLTRQNIETRAPVTRSRRRVAMTVAAIVIIALGGAVLWQMRPATTVEAPRIRSLAVLPLQNLSRDPDQEFFSDGATEALISNLAQIHDLEVISRTSVMRFKGTTKTVPEIGRELGVDAILAGSVQRVEGRVRITAQLIRVATDTHVWARQYERDAADVLKLEAEVARTIAQEIQAHLTPEEARRLASARSISPDAREAFLLGRYHHFKDNEADLRQAIEYFQRAIRLQPDYAMAYAGLSLSARLFKTRGFTQDEGAARTAAVKAIELDPNLGEAHAAMAGLKFDDWDWTGAETEAQRALELNYVDEYYPSLLTVTGRHAQAIAMAEHAAKLDPLSPIRQNTLGIVLYHARRYDEALAQMNRSIDLDPHNFAATLMVGAIFDAMGKPQAALPVFDRPDFRESPYMARAYALVGRRDDAHRILNGLAKRGGAFDLHEVAIAYFALGDKDRGFEWLTKAFDQRAGYVPWANVNDVFDGIRDDPRFKALVARLKLPG
ncbi:MAG TPA: protein kinase [Vicinamibacterales bacterium]|nr:protein kinase [Vicinamibacterales bacterium]